MRVCMSVCLSACARWVRWFVELTFGFSGVDDRSSLSRHNPLHNHPPAHERRRGRIALAQGVEHWKKFYADSKKYPKVGRVSHPSIDPASPVPEHCDPKKAKQATERAHKAEQEKAKAQAGSAEKHEEL